MSTYTELCLTCGESFTHERMHPMVEPAHCSACLAILIPLWRDLMTRGSPLRPDDV